MTMAMHIGASWSAAAAATVLDAVNASAVPCALTQHAALACQDDKLIVFLQNMACWNRCDQLTSPQVADASMC